MTPTERVNVEVFCGPGSSQWAQRFDHRTSTYDCKSIHQHPARLFNIKNRPQISISVGLGVLEVPQKVGGVFNEWICGAMLPTLNLSHHLSAKCTRRIEIVIHF